MIQSCPEIRGTFSKARFAAVPVVLLSPCIAEGSAVFHGARGDFFPGKTKISITEKTQCQLLMAKSRIVLNVTMHPPTVADDAEPLSFELVEWESLEQSPKTELAA